MTVPGIFPGGFWQSGLIKFKQDLTIVIAAGSASNTGTISQAVNTAKTILFYNGQRCADTSLNPNEDFVAVTLTNSTTVTATTAVANAGATRTVSVTVVEFYGDKMNNVVYGSITLSAATQLDVVITSANPAASGIFYLGQTTSRTTYNTIRDSVELTLQSALSARAQRGNTTAGDWITTNFCVASFAPGVLKGVQTASVAVPNNAASGTATIVSAVTDNCLTVYGGWRQSVLGISDTTTWPRGELTNATTLTGYVGVATSAQANIRLTVFEFLGQYIKSKQPGTISIPSGAGASARAINPVDTNYTIVGYLANTMSTNLSDNRAWNTNTLASSTIVSAERGGTPVGPISTIGHECLEFRP